MADKRTFEGEPEITMALGPLVGLAREDFVGAIAMMLKQTASDPQKTYKHARNFSEDVVRIVTGKSELAPAPRDKRFMDPAFHYNPFYKAGMQYFLAVQKNSKAWIDDLELDAIERDRANFISQMVIDALSPTNSLAGNPMAQKRVIDSGGLSVIKGLKNAYEDMTQNDFMVSQVDKKPFILGENVASSKGAVVYRSEIMELIHYAPTTDKVHAIPQLTIPPQINKMYINDLTPEKSVVKYQVDHGIQTFVISWRNPTGDQGEWGMTDYIDACIAALDVIQDITASKKVNVCGACSGGQTMSVLLSRLASEKQDRIDAVTMMVCALEARPGDTEASALVSDHDIALAKQRARRKGVIKATALARSFAWLRPNDLIWNYVINNYLMGEDPPAFDVLFWNSDATNLSATLMGDFLDLFEANAFAEPGSFEIAGHMLDLSKVKSDIFILAGVTDHITPWRACYRSTQMFGSKNVEFVLSHSGHMQAILNPPGNPKARYYKAKKDGKPPKSDEKWMAGTEEISGSWWPYWIEWLKSRSGTEKAAAKELGSKKCKPMEDAPGRYVVE